MNRIFLILVLSALSLRAVDSVVTFNELNYHPAGGSEWVELHNQMSVDVDLSGWRISSGVDFVFPEGTVISGRGWIVVASDPADPALSGALVVGPYTGLLSNGGEMLNLRNRSDRLMDTMDYRDGGSWPVAPDGSGATLAKRSGGLLSAKSISWSGSLLMGGSPGAENFPPPGASTQHAFVENSADWSFLNGAGAPPANWNTLAFNDAAWS
ncbi:lamin tail domain-containing protein, partial [Akkermansiaceae bacterium]|nr:lamin tail domain-containing protein [Akkermansiaceae bacterium]